VALPRLLPPRARARRSSQQLQAEGQLGLFLSTLWRFPLVYIFMFLIRFLLMAIFRPLFKITRQDLSFKEIAFACVAGLRGSVSLIMAQARVRPPARRPGLRCGLCACSSSPWSTERAGPGLATCLLPLRRGVKLQNLLRLAEVGPGTS